MENTIQVGGFDYPIRYDFTALKQVTKLIGGGAIKHMGQIDELIELDHIPDIARIGIVRGLAHSKDSRQAPTAEAIEGELNQRFVLMNEVIEIFGKDISGGAEAEQPATEGN